MPKLKLGEFLVQEGKITQQELENALLHQKRWGKRFGNCLVDLNYISEKVLCETLSKSLQIPIIDLSRIKPETITHDVIKLIPIDLARRYHTVPLMIKDLRGKKRLIVATPDPLNYDALEEVRFGASLPIFAMIAPERDVDWFITRYYGRNGAVSNYVSIVKMKRIGQKSEQLELISDLFEDSVFNLRSKRAPKKD